MGANQEVRHDPARNRFELELEGCTGHVDYRRDGDVLVVLHTIVPEAIGGQGVAGRLNAAVMAHAREAGLRVDPQCKYTASWLQRHPEHADLTV